MAEVDLHRERLQAIAEKRKRQAAIEDKRRQLEDKILQLQHLKSKSLREKWLMQGAPAGSSEEEEAKKKQCEEDEQTLKILEENVKRLEQDIGQLESEESLISAKEQILREKLKETAISFEDVQKSLSNQETDAVNYIYSQIPDLASFNLQNTETSLSGEGTARVAALYAMEINVEKDRNTGETKIVSASALDPEGVQQRGVKVYDDGNKVVYEVHHAGGVVENGIHKLSARDVDELIQKSQSNLIGGQEKECLPERTVTIEGNPSHVKEQMHFKEAKLELVHKSIKGVPVKHGQYDRSSENTGKDATLDQPITMIFMGYQNIDDEDETKKVLGYDDTIKAELVLIDEDDEKSLREKTVTDVSTMDGNAAELVSGKLLTETTEPSSPEGKEESLATEPIADVKKKTVQFKGPDDYEIEESLLQLNKPQVPEDDLNLKEKDQNSDNFSDPARLVISKETMEIDVPVSEHKGIILINQDGSAHDQSVFLAVVANQNGIKNRHESIDSDVAQEIQYLDDVLEANCCDTSADNTMNGSPTPELCTVGESSSYVIVTAPSASIVIETIAEEPKQAPVVEITEASEVMDPVKMNGHSQNGNKDEPFEGYTYPASPNSSNSSRRSSKDGDILPKIIKKEAKFELRTFHEEKKPSKLFDDFNEKEHIRVRKVRPSEEVQELEKERLELIKSQAVKKNSGITTKWWNPPQEKTIEEQLDSDQLESHQKYKERKQKLQQQGGSPPAVKANHLPPVLSETTAVKKEDIVTEQIDFLAARKQFLNMENTNQPNYKPPPKRSVSANLFTVRPFYKSSEASKSYSCITVTNPSVPCVQSVQGETPLVKAERVNCISEDQPTMNQRLMADASPEPSADIDLQDEKVSKRSAEEFVSATASFTVLKDDDSDLSDRFVKSVSVSFLPEEQDSGLDDLSIKSQDTTVMETLSNYFSMDNISDSGASNETMSAQHDYSLGDLSQPQTPVNDTLNEYILEEGSKYDQGFYSPSSMLQDIDDQLDYHAGVLVQNVIQQALAEKAGFKDSTHSEDSDKSNYFDDNEPLTEKSEIQSCSSPPVSPGRDQREVFEPPQVSSPVQVTKAITIPKTFEGENFQLKQDNPLSTKSLSPTEQNCTEEHKQESYFSKYSQSAELRSTASILATQETEISVGPFKLRSKKQKTLSMIEEEIRAAQEREQDLKKQRERQSSQSQHSPSNKSAPVLPTRTVSYKTAPGKIEKIRNPSSPRGESFPIQPDLLLEEATGSQRPKNLMETLMDDFESHKTKRRDRMDDATVLDAVRVNRRKSALALKWEAGIYANRDDDDE